MEITDFFIESYNILSWKGPTGIESNSFWSDGFQLFCPEGGFYVIGSSCLSSVFRLRNLGSHSNNWVLLQKTRWRRKRYLSFFSPFPSKNSSVLYVPPVNPTCCKGKARPVPFGEVTLTKHVLQSSLTAHDDISPGYTCSCLSSSLQYLTISHLRLVSFPPLSGGGGRYHIPRCWGLN